MKKLYSSMLMTCYVLLSASYFGCNSERNRANDLAKKIIPSVVLIETFDVSKNTIGLGSGFFIDDKGTFITNNHVIEGACAATIKTSSGNTYTVESVLAADMDVDLAKLAIEVPKEKLKYLHISPSNPSLGEAITVVGNPFGFESTLSTGIISAIRSNLPNGDLIQISAPISPGSSGGPVINNRGEVVGIATSTVNPGLGQNLNFAVPSTKILNLKPFISKKTLAMYADEIANPRNGYFPLVPGSRYEYLWQGYPDYPAEPRSTIYIREIDAVCFVSDDLLNKLKSGKMRWDLCNFSIYTPLGLGAYRRKGSRIFTFSIDWLNGPYEEAQREKKLEEREMLMLNLRIGDVFEIRGPGSASDPLFSATDIIEVVGFEAVVVPAGRFEDCVKLEIARTNVHEFNNYIPKTNMMYVWLAKNVGLVKYIDLSGYMRELVRFQIPNTSVVQ